jgi:hypothetical protein
MTRHVDIGPGQKLREQHMKTFESGGMLVVRPDRHMRALIAAFAFGAAAIALPPLIGVYLLVVA